MKSKLLAIHIIYSILAIESQMSLYWFQILNGLFNSLGVISLCTRQSTHNP